MKEVRPKG